MPLEMPKIDSSSFQEILQHALARVPVHTPEWTNLSESDPGVTLLELFAFMTESLLYRANLIPERNRIKFLQLLGLHTYPAIPAQGIVTFQNAKGPHRAVSLAGDLRVLAGQISFRTRGGVDVLPVEAMVCYKRALTGKESLEAEARYRSIHGLPDDTPLQLYRSTILPPPTDALIPQVDLLADTIDQTLWIALLPRGGERAEPAQLQAARATLGGRILNLGILPIAPEEGPSLLPAGLPVRQEHSHLDLAISTRLGDKLYFKTLPLQADGNPLRDAAILSCQLPPADEFLSWDRALQDDPDGPPDLEGLGPTGVVAWLRLRFHTSSGFAAKIGWVGLNAVRIWQTERVDLRLGQGNGEPEQSFPVPHPDIVAGSIRLTVDGIAWSETDDLLAAGPELPSRNAGRRPGAPQFDRPSQVFQYDREAGVIRFGDGLRGTRPPTGSDIRISYEFGGGRQGNVPIGSVTKASLPAGISLLNPLPTWGGRDPESTDEAERRIAQHLKHRERLVTAEDFREVTLGIPGIDLGRVEVRPLLHPHYPQDSVPGVVTLLVIPRADDAQRMPPKPDPVLLQEIARFLDQRRLVTTELFVQPPQYRPVSVIVAIDVVPGQDFPSVRAAVIQALQTFLSPIRGGHDGSGWPLGRPVTRSDLAALVARVPGVDRVNGLRMRTDLPIEMESIALEGLELPWLMEPTILFGEPDEDDPDSPDPGPAPRPIVAPAPLPEQPVPPGRPVIDPNLPRIPAPPEMPPDKEEPPEPTKPPCC